MPGRRRGDGPELVAAPDEQLVWCLAPGVARGLARGRCVGPARGRCGEWLDAVQQLLALTENGLLDLGQRRTGLQAEFVTQHTPGPAQRGQRVGLPIAGPQREGEKPPASLAQRLLADQGLSRRNGLGRGPGP